MKSPPKRQSDWLVQNIYLDKSWGSTYERLPYPTVVELRPRRGLGLRRLFVILMVAFGALDIVLATVFVWGRIAPPRSQPAPLAQQPETVETPALPVFQEPTRVARRAPTPTMPLPTIAPPTSAPVPPTAAPRIPEPTRVPPPTVVVQPTSPPTFVALAAPRNVSPARTIRVDLPETLSETALAVPIPPEPADCTPPERMPNIVTVSVKLCPGQVYRPFVLRGQDIGVFGDSSAMIRVSGRAFGIVAEGARLMIKGLVIRAAPEPSDMGILLCLYPDCQGRPGGSAYGGGILVRASDTTVMDSDIAGGVAGVAAERVRGLKLLNNRLDNSSGWGSYNYLVDESHFVGNSLSYDNRSCVAADGHYLPTGCESAGWVCIACHKNVIARNTCTNSGDCYYINGEGNLQSNDNKFHRNDCRASPHNCFEVTFSLRNEFVENTTGSDPHSGEACKYPFWVGGSHVIFSRNQWSCAISPSTAIRHATDSTSVPTTVETR